MHPSSPSGSISQIPGRSGAIDTDGSSGRTDHSDYAAAIQSALEGEPLLENAQAPAPHLRERRELPETAYQRESAAQRRPCFFFRHRRVKTIAASRSG
jgi:hypothetical protein